MEHLAKSEMYLPWFVWFTPQAIISANPGTTASYAAEIGLPRLSFHVEHSDQLIFMAQSAVTAKTQTPLVTDPRPASLPTASAGSG